MLSKNRNRRGWRGRDRPRRSRRTRRSAACRDRLEPVTARILPATSSACSTKGRLFGSVSASVNSERKKALHLRVAEDVGDAHLAEAHSFMAKKASSSAFTSSGVCASMRRKPPAASNLRVCERCFLRLRLPLARAEQRVESAGEVDGQRQVGARKMRQREQRIGDAVEIGQPAAPARCMSISGRALADRRDQRVDVGSVGRWQRRPASAAAKLPLAWRPPMKRATRNGPLRHDFQRERTAPAARRRSSVATKIVGSNLGDPVADPGRRFAPARTAPSRRVSA